MTTFPALTAGNNAPHEWKEFRKFFGEFAIIRLFAAFYATISKGNFVTVLVLV